MRTSLSAQFWGRGCFRSSSITRIESSSLRPTQRSKKPASGCQRSWNGAKCRLLPRFAVLDRISGLVQPVESRIYAEQEVVARERIGKRDEDDWPVLAAALVFGCPIWTEDTDFFGCGVATWTTDRIELFLTRM